MLSPFQFQNFVLKINLYGFERAQVVHSENAVQMLNTKRSGLRWIQVHDHKRGIKIPTPEIQSPLRNVNGLRSVSLNYVCSGHSCEISANPRIDYAPAGTGVQQQDRCVVVDFDMQQNFAVSALLEWDVLCPYRRGER